MTVLYFHRPVIRPYGLAGNPTLVTDTGEQRLEPGMCAGFRAGTGAAHQLVNREAHDAVFLAIGDRSQVDSARYAVDDLRAELAQDGQWALRRKDGTPY